MKNNMAVFSLLLISISTSVFAGTTNTPKSNKELISIQGQAAEELFKETLEKYPNNYSSTSVPDADVIISQTFSDDFKVNCDKIEHIITGEIEFGCMLDK